MRLALLDEIRRVAGFDAYSRLLTDPETEVGCAPLADVPCPPELPRLIRLKYLTPGSGERFTDAEAEFMTAIAAPVTEALRRCQARTFDLVASGPQRTGPIVLVLSQQLEVRAQTAETDTYLRTLVLPDADRAPIPSEAYNVAAQLLAIESGVDDHPPSARVHLSGGTWLTLRAARIGAGVATDEEDIAVTIEATSPAERTAVFARAFGLSARETELLSHLVTGADTHGIAQEMSLSEHTVQDHLKSIFAKTATRNRRTLLARSAGR